MATILTKRSNTASSVPLAADLTNSTSGAELAVNTADKRVYTKDSGGNVVELGTNPSSLALPSGSVNGVVYLNGSKVLTTGSALTFDGTIQGITTSASGGLRELLRLSNNGSGDGTSAQMTFYAASTNYAQITGGYIGAPALISNVGSAGYQAWQINSSEQMRLTSTGLGIGTSSPTAKLDVTTTQNGATRVRVNNQSSGASAVAGVLLDAYGGSWTIDVPASTTFVNPLQFIFGGSEKMRLDSAGNLGLGVTPSAWGSGGNLQIGSTKVIGFSGEYGNTVANAYYNAGWKYASTAPAVLYEMYSGSHRWHVAPSGTAGAAISFTQAMTLDASGNLCVGITAPLFSATTDILSLSRNHANNTDLVVSNQTNNTSAASRLRLEAYGGGWQLTVPQSSTFVNPLIFSFGGTERARIDSSGNLLLGQTGTGYQNSNSSYLSNQAFIQSHASGTGNATKYAGFGYAGSEIGSITQAGTTATAYNTSSDYRLKNITGPVTNSGAYIDSLNPVEGTWKTDGSTFVGLIAHEAQEVSRTPVATGVKDGKEMQSMDYSSSEIIANLIAEIKSLRVRVAHLESN